MYRKGTRFLGASWPVVHSILVNRWTFEGEGEGRGRGSFKQWLLVYLTVLHTGPFVVQIAKELAGDGRGFCEALGFSLSG